MRRTLSADAAGESPAIQSLSADAASERRCGGGDVREPECESATSLHRLSGRWTLATGISPMQADTFQLI